MPFFTTFIVKKASFIQKNNHQKDIFFTQATIKSNLEYLNILMVSAEDECLFVEMFTDQFLQ